jgi:hypothetical protein
MATLMAGFRWLSDTWLRDDTSTNEDGGVCSVEWKKRWLVPSDRERGMEMRMTALMCSLPPRILTRSSRKHRQRMAWQ